MGWGGGGGVVRLMRVSLTTIALARMNGSLLKRNVEGDGDAMVSVADGAHYMIVGPGTLSSPPCNFHVKSLPQSLAHDVIELVRLASCRQTDGCPSAEDLCQRRYSSVSLDFLPAATASRRGPSSDYQSYM